MAEIMTTKEMAAYLKLHEITICKYAAEGVIPAIRIGRVWRFDKEEIDNWIGGSHGKPIKSKESRSRKSKK
ncbi:MAG: helix-turn-helix domain-containing protein [Candidatus Desulfacyla sp.]